MLHRFKKAIVLLVSLCMVLGAAVFFAACGEKKEPPEAIDQTTLQYDGYSITWGAVDRVTKYEVNVNGNAYTTTGIAYGYSAESIPAETYAVTITAINEYGSSAPVSKTFTKLPTIELSSVTFTEEGEMMWTTVQGANSYEVEVNGAVKETAVTTFSEFDYGKTNKIRIRPHGADGYFSLWSGTISKTYLSAPTNVKYDNQFISWSGDPDAKGYSVYINGRKDNIEPITERQYRFNSADADFSLEVRAEGDGEEVFPSKMSEKIDFVYLGKVDNIRVEEGTLKWEPLPKAVSYIVKVGTKEYPVTEPQYKLTSGSTQTVQILPQGADKEHTFANWSDEERYNILAAPQPTWDGSIDVVDGENHATLRWNSVSGGGVNGYRVKYTTPNDEAPKTETVQDGLNVFSYDFPETGIYTLSVQTLAEAGGDYYDSAYCEPFTIERLPAPTYPINNITSDPIDLGKGFTVTFNSVSGAARYRLYKDKTATDQYAEAGQTSFKVTQGLKLENQSDVETISFAIQSIGGGVKGRYVTLSSLLSEPNEFDIRILPKPRGENISGKTLSWNSIANAKGYSVEVEDHTDVSSSEFDLKSITAPGDHTVKVCAKGDGAALLPSDYTSGINVRKLDAPSRVRVIMNEDDGRLSWDEVTGAQSYNVYFDGTLDPQKENGQVNIGSHISKGTTVVVVEACADYWNDGNAHDFYWLGSDLSITYTFTKLDTPTFGAEPFTNTELLWNAPRNTTDQGNVAYEVYDGIYAIPGSKSAPRYDISNLESGTHSFQVRAISLSTECVGNGTAFVNSDKSESVSIKKLATPTVTHTNTEYTWDPVGEAVGYVVKIAGKEAAGGELDASTCHYAPVFKNVSISEAVSIDIIAVGSGKKGETIDSAPFHIDQVVRELATPKVNRPTYVRDSNGGGGTITVTLKEAVSNARAYRFLFTGSVQGQELTTLTCSAHSDISGKITASVVALGGVFGSQDGDREIFFVDSNEGGGNDAASITVYGTPSSSGIKVSADGLIKWNGITGCFKYRVKITYGSDTVEVDVQNAYEFLASGDKVGNRSPKEITKIEIQALGDGVTTFDSDWAQWYPGM